MAYRLAAKLSDRIAAIAPVSGQIAPGQLDPPPRRPIPIIHFHGRDDVWNPWEGGAPEKSGFTNVKVLPVTEVIAAWAKHNGCPAQPSISKPVGNAVKSTYAPCREGADVVLWELRGGGHTWPGGGGQRRSSERAKLEFSSLALLSARSTKISRRHN
jgi:polyhydroxybutyrate depolymerase